MNSQDYTQYWQQHIDQCQALAMSRHVRIVVRSSESVKFRWRGQDTDDGSIFNRAQRSRVEKVIAT